MSRRVQRSTSWAGVACQGGSIILAQVHVYDSSNSYKISHFRWLQRCISLGNVEGREHQDGPDALHQAGLAEARPCDRLGACFVHIVI